MEEEDIRQVCSQQILSTNEFHKELNSNKKAIHDQERGYKIFLEGDTPKYVDDVSSDTEIDITKAEEDFRSVGKGDLQDLWAEPRTFSENWTGFLKPKTKSEPVMKNEQSTQHFQEQIEFLEPQNRNSAPNPSSSKRTQLIKSRKRVTIVEEHSSSEYEDMFSNPKRYKGSHQVSA